MSTNLKQGAIIQGEKNAYIIEKVLGQGSFGITYLAQFKTKLSGAMGSGYVTAQVCIKEFFMKDFNTRDEQTGSLNDTSGVTIVERYRKAFMREAKNLAKMQHPGIVNVFEVIEANNTVYIVLEYIDGGSLDDYILSTGRLSEGEALRCILPICEAMDYMHRCRMLHLDMKPKNVMRDKEGHLYLIDFGLSKQYDANGEPESSTSIGLGTPGYAPTEQAVQKIDDEHNFRATIDVYALGATLYKMLTGQTPPLATEVSDSVLDGEDLIQQNLTQIGVSKSLAQTVSKAMWPSSKKRLQSIAELKTRLQASMPMGEDALIDANDNAIDETLDTPSLYNSQNQSLDDFSTSLKEDTAKISVEEDQEYLVKEAETESKAQKESEDKTLDKVYRKERRQAGLKEIWIWSMIGIVIVGIIGFVWSRQPEEDLSILSAITDKMPISSQNTVPNTTDTIAVQELILSGLLGKQPIHMKLRIEGNEITGTYYYDRYSTTKDTHYMTLQGYYSDTNTEATKIVIDEYSEGEKLGKFSGKISEQTYSGIFERDNRRLKFNLHATDSY